jgi:hypothetical protein
MSTVTLIEAQLVAPIQLRAQIFRRVLRRGRVQP